MEIRIHRILSGSRANGPGIRNVVWLQGCTLNCAGCFNPQTHDPQAGIVMTTDSLCDELLRHNCDGITISGGEPFQQPEALLDLLRRLRERESSPVLIFSGYTFQEIKEDPKKAACIPFTDALICGPYLPQIPPAYERFCSSGNQELILISPHYSPEDFVHLLLSEIIIDAEGNILRSGIRFCLI